MKSKKHKYNKYGRYGTGRKFKNKRSFFKRKQFWQGVLTVAVVGGLCYFLFFSPVFKIISDSEANIQINGVLDVEKELVYRKIIGDKLGAKILFVLSKNNLFLADKHDIASKLMVEYPEIAEVSIKKKFPKTLILEIKNRKKEAVFCFNQNTCFFIDKKGVIFDEIMSQNDVPEKMFIILDNTLSIEVFELGSVILEQSIMDKILMIEQKISIIPIIILEFILEQGNKVVIRTQENWEIYLSLDRDLGLDLVKLKLLLEQELTLDKRKNLQYIDLRFSKVYYK